jgi:hypothetical protein
MKRKLVSLSFLLKDNINNGGFFMKIGITEEHIVNTKQPSYVKIVFRFVASAVVYMVYYIYFVFFNSVKLLNTKKKKITKSKPL